MNDWVDAESRAERAYDLYEQGRWTEAAAELKAALDINPYNAAWHFNLALTLESLEQYDAACLSYERSLDLEGSDVETLNCLGVNLTRIGRYDEAIAKFAKAQRHDPNYEPAYCNRIVTYTEMGDHDSAELMFYLARQIREECPLCYYNMGNSFFARRENKKAISCWQESVRIDSSHRHAHARIAEALWMDGDLEGAAHHYQAELQLVNDDDVDVMLDYGDLLTEMGKFEQAREQFENSLAIEPDSAEAHFLLGELAAKQLMFNEAELRYRQAIELDPKYPGAHTRLARMLLRQDSSESAATHLLAELDSCHDDPDVLGELGELLIEVGQLPQANLAFKRLVSLRPDDSKALHNLAVSFFMLDKMDEGINHCRKALKVKPGYSLALYNLALAFLQKGLLARARRYASQALMAAPTDEEVTELSRQLSEIGLLSKIQLRLAPPQRRQDLRM